MSDGARGQSGHGCWFPLGLWFPVAAPASNLQLCSLDSSGLSWAPPGVTTGTWREARGEKQNWSQTVRGRQNQGHRQSEVSRERHQDTEKQREPETDTQRERERGGRRKAETAQDTETETQPERKSERERERQAEKGGTQTQTQNWLWKGRGRSRPSPHLELVPGVGMEAVPTAASQVQAGVTKGLVRAAPADEAAAVVVPE